MNTQPTAYFKTLTTGETAGRVAYATLTKPNVQKQNIVMQGYFYFGLVTNGTATLWEGNNEQLLPQAHLFALTPSMKANLNLLTSDCQINCIRITPAFFDTLHDGQPIYNQLASFLSKGSRFPVILIEYKQYTYLKKTFSLFDELLDTFILNQEGIVRHLCGFCLLQLTNALYTQNGKASACVMRPNEIYRNFKKLAATHYRHHHDISFYAGQLHISPTYLSRIVKSVTGRTVHTILTELIYADAIRCLDCTDMDIKEIAESLGFSDQSSFGKFFMKRAHTSPSRFRQRKQPDNMPQTSNRAIE